jgi:hypothetical protein
MTIACTPAAAGFARCKSQWGVSEWSCVAAAGGIPKHSQQRVCVCGRVGKQRQGAETDALSPEHYEGWCQSMRPWLRESMVTCGPRACRRRREPRFQFFSVRACVCAREVGRRDLHASGELALCARVTQRHELHHRGQLLPCRGKGKGSVSSARCAG